MAKGKSKTAAPKAAKYERPRILVAGFGAAEKVVRAGGEPVQVDPRGPRLAEAAAHENIHGLLLLGGGDVDPALYGMKPDSTVYGVSTARDEAEWDALTEARDRGIPVLGICRGSQIMNVHAGGTLFLDIERDANSHEFHRGCDHRTNAVEGSRLHEAWGKQERWVISIHHQAVQKLGKGLQVAATALDGIVEAIESDDPERWELGVQFHPEMAEPSQLYHQRIFDAFVAAAGARAGIAVKPRTWDKPVTVPPSKTTRPAAPKPARIVKPASVEAARKARTYSGTYGGPVNVTWRCFSCRVTFDEQLDYVDHMAMLHDEVVEMAGTDRSKA